MAQKDEVGSKFVQCSIPKVWHNVLAAYAREKDDYIYKVAGKILIDFLKKEKQKEKENG